MPDGIHYRACISRYLTKGSVSDAAISFDHAGVLNFVSGELYNLHPSSLPLF